MATMMPLGVLTATPVALLIAGKDMWPLSAKAWIAACLLGVLTGMVGHGLIAFAQREVDPESYTVRYNAACTYAVIGKLDLALEALEFAFSHAPRSRGWLLAIAKHDTQLDPLRQRSDFQDLIKRLEENAAAQS